MPRRICGTARKGHNMDNREPVKSDKAQRTKERLLRSSLKLMKEKGYYYQLYTRQYEELAWTVSGEAG